MPKVKGGNGDAIGVEDRPNTNGGSAFCGVAMEIGVEDWPKENGDSGEGTGVEGGPNEAAVCNALEEAPRMPLVAAPPPPPESIGVAGGGALKASLGDAIEAVEGAEGDAVDSINVPEGEAIAGNCGTCGEAMRLKAGVSGDAIVLKLGRTGVAIADTSGVCGDGIFAGESVSDGVTGLIVCAAGAEKEGAVGVGGSAADAGGAPGFVTGPMAGKSTTSGASSPTCAC